MGLAAHRTEERMSDDAGVFLRSWFDRLSESGWTSEDFLGALADDLVWTATGTSPISGTYHGRDAYIDGIYSQVCEVIGYYDTQTVTQLFA
jgi:ketosteroid isomerase-like protein